MSLAVKTVKATSPEGLAILVQENVAKGWRPIDDPGRLLHDGKPRNGEEWVVHMQRRTSRA